MPSRRTNRSSSNRSSKNHRALARRQAGQPLQPLSIRAVPPTWDPMIVDSAPMPMPRKMPSMMFRRTYTLATLSANTGDTVNAFNFTLSALPNYAEFTSLFDQYRILEVVLSFMPYANQSQSTTVSSGFPGIVGSWIEYEDASLPANLQEGQQYDTYQRNLATEPFVRSIKPRSAVAAYSGAFTSYSNVYGIWQDTNSPSIQYYGCKTVITGSTYATSTKVYEVEATVTLQCRVQK